MNQWFQLRLFISQFKQLIPCVDLSTSVKSGVYYTRRIKVVWFILCINHMMSLRLCVALKKTQLTNLFSLMLNKNNIRMSLKYCICAEVLQHVSLNESL